MAATAHKEAREKQEHFDAPDVLARKLDRLADWIRHSKHMMAFTGAGISTACGIPDFRSGMNTVLATGPGVWELRAQKKARSSKAKTTTTLSAIPSKTHMMLVELQRRNLLKHLVSQNTDGLHRRSGFPPAHLSELHGNSNLESCPKCGQQYLRDFHCRRRGNKVHDHRTGRACTVPGCGGGLRDSIINFGENLPDKDIDDAFRHAARADLCVAMGSSLRVTPAADVPEEVGDRRGSRLVIVNLQSTPMDSKADLVIHALCDAVAEGLAERLFGGADRIPAFTLYRHVAVGFRAVRAGSALRGHSPFLRGTDSDGTGYSLFRDVAFGSKDASLSAGGGGGGGGGLAGRSAARQAATRVAAAEGHDHSEALLNEGSRTPEALQWSVAFMGHYGESPLDLRLEPAAGVFAIRPHKAGPDGWVTATDQPAPAAQAEPSGGAAGGGGAGDDGRVASAAGASGVLVRLAFDPLRGAWLRPEVVAPLPAAAVAPRPVAGTPPTHKVPRLRPVLSSRAPDGSVAAAAQGLAAVRLSPQAAGQ